MDMIRTQIQLTEKQAKTLKTLSARRRVSTAELIRQGIDQYLETQSVPSLDSKRDRAKLIVGKFRSGISDLSERHDDYLDEAFRS